MSTNKTTNLGLHSWVGTDYVKKIEFNDNFNTIDSEFGSQNTQNISIEHGLQTITTDQATPLSASINGRTLINHMGRQGSFEEQGQWDANLVIDTATYKFGTASGKIDNSAGTATKTSFNSQKEYLSGKYVVIGINAKAVSGTPQINFSLIERDSAGTQLSSVQKGATTIDTTYKFYYFKADLTANTGDHWTSAISVNTYGTTSDVVNFDGMVVYEITSAEYSATETQAEAEKKWGHPTQAVKHVMNPVVKGYGKNLLPPFTEWDNPSGIAEITSPYSMDLVVTDGGAYESNYKFRCNANQDYIYSISRVDGYIGVKTLDENGNLITNYNTSQGQKTVVFTTENNAYYIEVRVSNGNLGSGTYTFTNPQLELGSTATDFQEQNESYLYGAYDSANKSIQLASNLDGSVRDQLYERDGQWYRLNRFERDVVLDGALSWGSVTDYTGYKRVAVIAFIPDNTSVEDKEIAVKYDGKIIRSGVETDGADIVDLQSSNGNLLVTISDTDSGWTDAMTGTTITADFIKGYFNGWKYTGDGTTHSWAQINDATVTSTSATYVADPANSHADWTPYELTYQLDKAWEEAVTAEGAVSLIEGQNQVGLEEGVIVREVLNPTLYNGNYHVNDTTWSSSQFKHRTKSIIEIYKNGDEDKLWDITTGANAYGDYKATIPEADFDTTAQYTVTYLVLDKYALTSNVQDAEGEYNTNLKTVVGQLVEDQEDLATRVSQHDITKANRVQGQWIEPTLLNGWVNYGSSNAKAGYFKDEFGLVHVKGLIKSGTTTSGTVITRLPKGYRPKESLHVISPNNNGTSTSYAVFQIQTDGDIAIDSASGNSWLSITLPPFRAEQ